MDIEDHLVDKHGWFQLVSARLFKNFRGNVPLQLSACPARPEGPVSGAITKTKLGAALGLSSFLDSAVDPLDGGAERARLLPSASGAAVGEHEVLHGDHVVQRQADDPTE